MTDFIEELAGTLVLGALLTRVGERCGGYTLLDHWQQGEFHHDVVVRVNDASALPGPVLVVSTNCNGGVKEVLCFDDVPQRDALWHARCPSVDEFAGELAPIRAQSRTLHWFEPCELLGEDARSELRPEFRKRQRGGGWEPTCGGGGGSCGV